MENSYVYAAILVMALVNLFTRAFPFLFFTKKEPPAFILFIERNFPPIIMTILIFYSLKEVSFGTFPYGTKEILALVFTIALHLRFGNYLVSIFAGTVFYMGCVQFV